MKWIIGITIKIIKATMHMILNWNDVYYCLLSLLGFNPIQSILQDWLLVKNKQLVTNKLCNETFIWFFWLTHHL